MGCFGQMKLGRKHFILTIIELKLRLLELNDQD
jgi:hypothetical protein